MKLYTDNVVKIYGKRTVVRGASVQVRQGEVVGLLGPNGAGKTTTFYMVVGIIKPYSGKVYLAPESRAEGDRFDETVVERDGRAALLRDGEFCCVLPEGITPTTPMPIELTRNPMYRRAQMGVGYLAQEASVFRQMSVEENIMSILEFRRDLSDKAKRQEKLESLLDEFHLQHIRRSKGIQLSGGERRRTEIARALANDPMFLLLDEPFAGVDPIAVQDIQDIVVELTKRNIGVLITDHNVRETLCITDHAYLLYEGSILQQGTPEVLANDPEVCEKYLGRDFVLKRRKKV